MGTDLTADSTQPFRNAPARPGALPDELAALLDARGENARERAWKNFLESHSRLLCHVTRTAVRGYDEAMDRYAYVLERLRANDFRRLRTYTPRSGAQFSSWLGVVAGRMCVDFCRERYGRPEGVEPSEALKARKRLLDFVSCEIDEAIVEDTGAMHPDGALRAKELARALDDVVASVPSRDRVLLALRFEHGASAREIAEALNFPSPFHVYRQLKKILAKLRTALSRRGIDDSKP
jgi:RNA polymerase sigma factor (sigma-70 family)